MAPRKKRKPAPPKKRLSATIQWVLIGLAGAAILFVFVLLPAFQEPDPGPPGDVTAEAFDLPVLDDDDPNNRVLLSDYAGTPTVVNFFASWCFICEEELPAFRRVERELGNDVDFIFVNSNETGDWRPMAQRTGISNGATLARDIDGINRNGLYRSLGGTGAMPITAFYDADGNLVETVFAPFTDSQLMERLEALGMAS